VAEAAGLAGRPQRSVALIAILLLSRALINWAWWRHGFFAISDDDFARIGIAQQFAHAPSLDPSGSSWLPFWLLGSWLKVFGLSLKAAQWCGFVFSLLSVGLYWVAVHWFGFSMRATFWACLGLTVLPLSLALGLACVPEGYTAALCLLAVASTLAFTVSQRGVGALAVFAATLCRYETWPIAGLFAGLVLCDVLTKRLPRRALWFAGLSLLGIAGWLLHGAINQHDALFFLARVNQYRHALEGTASQGSSTLNSALSYPALIFRSQPEVSVVLVLGLLFNPALKDFLGRYKRAFGFVGVLSLFLIVGELSHSGATHHLERPLLTVWLLMIVMSVDAWGRIVSDPLRRKPALIALGICVLILGAVRNTFPPSKPFDRSEEIAIATLAKPIIESDPGVVAIDCPDYGYLAVAAALAMPGQALPVHTHDPRGDVTRSPQSLGARWLIADAQSPLLADSGGRTVGQSGHFLLQRLPAGAPQ